jgi:hypothetical protein
MGCVANRWTRTEVAGIVFIETLYSWAFQRLGFGPQRLETAICNTSRITESRATITRNATTDIANHETFLIFIGSTRTSSLKN